jgi:hypothetical protein
MVYSKQGKRLGFLLYDEQADRYRVLYDSIQVEDGLDSQECNYRCGRLDDNLAEEMVAQAGYFVKDPSSFEENKQLKITDITKDADIEIKNGCLSKKATKADFKNVLCITTSYIYNSWKCLRYDKTKDAFVIFFHQTYSD